MDLYCCNGKIYNNNCQENLDKDCGIFYNNNIK